MGRISLKPAEKKFLSLGKLTSLVFRVCFRPGGAWSLRARPGGRDSHQDLHTDPLACSQCWPKFPPAKGGQRCLIRFRLNTLQDFQLTYRSIISDHSVQDDHLVSFFLRDGGSMKVKLFLGEGRDQAMLQFRDYFSRPLSSMGRSILSVTAVAR